MQSNVFRGSRWVCRAGIVVRAWESMVFSLLCFVGEVLVVELIELRTVQVGVGTVEVEIRSHKTVKGRHRNPKRCC